MTNQKFLKIIKVRLEGAKGVWLDELPSVLWAYRTTARTPTGETPFNLIYGTEAVIPIVRREFFSEDQLKLSLDCLDEVRNEASKRIAKYQQKMTTYYN